MNILSYARPFTLLLFAADYIRQSISISETRPVTYIGLTTGCWEKEEYEATWCDYPSGSSGAKDDGEDCRQIITQDPNEPRNTYMTLTLPANTIGGSDGGMASSLDIKTGPSNTKECINEERVSWTNAWLQYDVSFADDFDWSRGGKLPGLTTYPDSPTGCIDNNSFDGDSVRYMWREKGEFKLYLYNPEKIEECGDYFEMSPPLFLNSGQWYTLTQEVQLNNVGKSNGYVKVWVDGVAKLNLQNLVLRRDGDIYQNQLKMDCFRGGSSSDWASPIDGYVSFDNFRVSQTSLLESSAPTKSPTQRPSQSPTPVPSNSPTVSSSPTSSPITSGPTDSPVTSRPTAAPTERPTSEPTTSEPTIAPSSSQPTITFQPTFFPTHKPTKQPTSVFSRAPSPAQTQSHPNVGMYLGIAIGSICGGLCVLMVFWESAEKAWNNNSDVNDPLIEAEEGRRIRPS